MVETMATVMHSTSSRTGDANPSHRREPLDSLDTLKEGPALTDNWMLSFHTEDPNEFRGRVLAY